MAKSNGGKLKLFTTETAKDAGNVLVVKAVFENDLWFEYLDVYTEEYYASKQANVKIDIRVRVRRNHNISSQSMIQVKGKMYEIGRVTHGFDKGNKPVTDVSLGRTEAVYVFSGV